MMPEEVVQAGIDLKANKILPVHWGKFSLSLHSWDEPIMRVTAEAQKRDMILVAPLIGQRVNLDETSPSIPWWENIE